MKSDNPRFFTAISPFVLLAHVCWVLYHSHRGVLFPFLSLLLQTYLPCLYITSLFSFFFRKKSQDLQSAWRDGLFVFIPSVIMQKKNAFGTLSRFKSLIKIHKDNNDCEWKLNPSKTEKKRNIKHSGISKVAFAIVSFPLKYGLKSSGDGLFDRIQ